MELSILKTSAIKGEKSSVFCSFLFIFFYFKKKVNGMIWFGLKWNPNGFHNTIEKWTVILNHLKHFVSVIIFVTCKWL